MNEILQQEPVSCTAELDEQLCTNFTVTFAMDIASDIVDVTCLGPCTPETACLIRVTNPVTGQMATYAITLASVQQIGANQRWCYSVSVQGNPALSHWVLELCNPPPMVTSVTRNGVAIPFSVGPQADLGGEIGIKFDAGTSQSDGVVLYCFEVVGHFDQVLRDVAGKGGPAPATVNQDCQPGPACPCPIP
ncbi:MAG: hypothetical protein GX986_02365 [Firmicutes bacterium]|nr:hypothetical protein [Bacillota bacterium]